MNTEHEPLIVSVVEDYYGEARVIEAFFDGEPEALAYAGRYMLTGFADRITLLPARMGLPALYDWVNPDLLSQPDD